MAATIRRNSSSIPSISHRANGLGARRAGRAAPDILTPRILTAMATELVKKLYSGFATHNYQARVNGLTWASTLVFMGRAVYLAAKMESLVTGQKIDLSGRDFRIKPDTCEIDPLPASATKAHPR